MIKGHLWKNGPRKCPHPLLWNIVYHLQELDYIHKRTREGVKRAKERYAAETVEGKPHMKKLPGRPVGYKYVHKSEAEKKEKILKYSKSFYGSNTDTECMKLIGIARNTFYKYKRELKDV